MRGAGVGAARVLAVSALSAALVGCGTAPPASDPTPAPPDPPSSSSAGASSGPAPLPAGTPTAAPPIASAPHQTISDYVARAGLTETEVKPGDPGAPTIVLPTPAGWRDPGPQTPRYAYAARVYDNPAVAADPATILALVARLTGPVDGARILEYAPGELLNLPGFEGSAEGTANSLDGFDAVQLGGSYVQDGNRRMIAQKTVVIPAADGSGIYVLQVNANGLEGQMGALLDAIRDIDDNTTITP